MKWSKKYNITLKNVKWTYKVAYNVNIQNYTIPE